LELVGRPVSVLDDCSHPRCADGPPGLRAYGGSRMRFRGHEGPFRRHLRLRPAGRRVCRQLP
jgi:hypothetical protein